MKEKNYENPGCTKLMYTKNLYNVYIENYSLNAPSWLKPCYLETFGWLAHAYPS